MWKLIFAILLPCGCAAAESAQGQKAAPIAPLVTPYRVTFAQWDGDPAKPQTLAFDIRLDDFRTPFCFPSLGAVIPRTKVRLGRFEYKRRKAADGKWEDVSELTLLNTETNKTALLVLGEQQDIRGIVELRITR